MRTTEMNAETIGKSAMMDVNKVRAGATAVSDVAEVVEEAENETTMDGKMSAATKTVSKEEAEIDRPNGASDERRQESANSGKSVRRKQKWNAK